MARFDVYEVEAGKRLVIDCQSDFLDHFNTRFVVPLLPAKQVPPGLERLNPSFEIDRKTLVMATHLATSIPVKAIKRTVTTLRDSDQAIMRALDTLISDA